MKYKIKTKKSKPRADTVYLELREDESCIQLVARDKEDIEQGWSPWLLLTIPKDGHEPLLHSDLPAHLGFKITKGGTLKVRREK